MIGVLFALTFREYKQIQYRQAFSESALQTKAKTPTYLSRDK